MRYLLTFFLITIGLAVYVPSISAQGSTVDLCINDFQDDNANGIQDSTEPTLPNIEVFLQQNGTVIASLTTTAEEDCFRSLAAGEYQVEFQVPAGYTATSETTLTLTLTNPANSIDFGAVVANTSTTNQICFLVFNDENINARRESTEALMRGVDANLLVDDVVVATQISRANEKVCFTGLGAGRYSVHIPPSANHVMVSRRDFSVDFAGATGQLVDISYGAQPINPLPRADETTAEDGLEFDAQTRLVFAFAGAMTAMFFMVGLGVILFGLIRRQ